ncbi:benzoylformate decarboxylase [Hephaestia sp. GCM10023244]|uniref:benzoylformate decarboxylase n=1 Tax=unclassified Hephaestia TaxID=2631281 RepID=UPI002077161D|nr:benzoylformate decarboxylase [Hephaestia sp. MAHUQ-44]MCM8732054.1 benzoylformate decarboxylase [Hephaestia sp. MAHUQ-44]
MIHQNTPGATTVRSATFDLLRAFGISTIFGNPGSTELPMYRDLPEDFRYVLGLQESIVLGMADGFAQATRNAALVNLHSAVGVGHALGNLFTAFVNQTPLIVTAGQQARSILPFEPFLFAAQPTEFPKPYVKWAVEPARAEDVPLAIARAYHIAMQPPCGPVFVSIPIDDWDRPCDPVAVRRVSHAIEGEAALLAEAAAALAAAERPAFVVGAQLARDGAWDQAIALAERHSAAVFASPNSARNSFPEDHPYFAGFLPASREEIVKRLHGHDLILVLGAPVFTYHVEGAGPHIPEGATLFQLVDNPGVASWAGAGTAITTSLKPGIDALLAGPAPRPRAPVPPRVSLARLDANVLSDAYVMQQVAALRPPASIIVEEAPSSRLAMRARLPMIRPDSFYTTASGGLGHAMPAAVGIAMARPGEKLIALIGDGSCMYAVQALWSAAQHGLPISFLILNNARYEALVRFSQRFGMNRTVGTELPGLDFCALAQGHGMEAVRVEQAADLDATLTRSFADPRPNLVEIRID